MDTTEVIRVVDSLLEISRSFTEIDFEKAEEEINNAENLAEEKLGRQSSTYASVCFGRGRLFFYGKNDFQIAKKWFTEAKNIQEKALGKSHPKYALSLHVIGVTNFFMADHEKAISLCLEANAIWEKALGRNNPDFFSSLLFLGSIYLDLAAYEKAEMYYLEAIKIAENILGKEHPHYTGNLNNLGICYRRMGKYEKAEQFYLEAKSLSEKVLGKEDPSYNQVLTNLGTLYLKMGNYRKAEAFFLETISITEKLFGKEHPKYAKDLNNLGILYYRIENYTKAEKFYLDAKTINKLSFDEQNFNLEYTGNLMNLGNLYSNIEEYTKAELFYLEAKLLTEKALGKEHHEYTMVVNNLGKLYYKMGLYQKAESYLSEAMNIKKVVLSPFHFEYTINLMDLAILYWETDKFDKASKFYLEANKINKTLLANATRHLSVNELFEYNETINITQNQGFSFDQIQSRIEEANYDNTLFYKGFLLNATGQISRLALMNSTSTEKYLSLKSYHRRLATEYTKPLNDRKRVEEFEEKVNNLEKELSRNVADFGKTIRQVTWQEVQDKLHPGQAAIEFINYQFHNPKETDSTMYAALILRPNDTKPQFIPLFEEKSLNTLLIKEGNRRAEYVNNLYINSEESLFDLIWKPIEKELGDTKTVYYSPSGLLHLINLGALSISENEILGDRYQLNLLNSTRELVIKLPEKVDNTIAVLYGGIQYESDGIAQIESPSESSDLTSRSRGILEFNQIDSTLRGDRTWEYLPSTQEEIASLMPIFKKENLTITTQESYSATEESFKALSKNGENPSPNIIHIATHGYFFPDPVSTSANPLGVGGEREPIFKMSDHPMIRSGLLFAGANHAWKKGKPIQPNMEDGILTAYEISQMDLSDTELVVLSACETGLGDIKGNEGVYGLQRAFKIAGVNNIMMSLWQVPDYHTKELMVRFYQNWLEKEMDIRAALLAAQNSMRDEGYEPFHWAGFVILE